MVARNQGACKTGVWIIYKFLLKYNAVKRYSIRVSNKYGIGIYIGSKQASFGLDTGRNGYKYRYISSCIVEW